MPVLGAILTLSEEAPARDSALAFLREHPAITLGEPQLLGWPVAIETGSRAEEKAVWNELEAWPGILFATVVYNDFSDLIEKEEVLP